MARVGILGGTFDPPHTGHIVMAERALAEIPLDEVLFMPAPRPPHKATESLTLYEHRRTMIELAIAGRPGLRLSTFEEEHDGTSFTADMLRRYKSGHADDVFFIVGADSVAELGTWREPEAILELVTLVVFPRVGYSPAVPVPGDAAVVLFDQPIIDVSSTDVRARVERGEPISGMVPDSVERFILDNSLYS